MKMTSQITLETYSLFASNGRYIRQASRIVLSNGTKISLIEKITKREAIRLLESEWEKVSLSKYEN